MFNDNLLVVKSTFASFKFTPLAFIIRTSLELSPLSYLRPTLIDFIFTLDPNKTLTEYLSLISSKLKLLDSDRLYLNDGPPKILNGPKTL
jgi:hypothetical protein